MDFNSISSIVTPALVIGGMGLALGLILGIMGKVFHVEQDENVAAISAFLPGVNCGACGYAGCATFAQNLADGNAKPSDCPPASDEARAKIAEIMGVELEAVRKAVAYVKCAGGHSNSTYREGFEKLAIDDCRAVESQEDGGAKACRYGCVGYNSCGRVCPFDAIDIVDGIAVINDKCTACGVCVAACPRDLISIIPKDSVTRVACNSKELGKVVREVCQNGCIGCRLCARACGDQEAVLFADNLAKIDYDKCTTCEACIEKCPTKCILKYNGTIGERRA